jgi:hypothetical protein
MKQNMRQYLLGLKILGLATLIGAIVIGALIIFVGPIVMGFFKNPTAATIALGKAFAFGVALCAVWALVKYVMRGGTKVD